MNLPLHPDRMRCTFREAAPERPATGPDPFSYAGPDALKQPVMAALSRVFDPELSWSIADVGLVYGVTVDAEAVHVRLTITSAACPLIDLIVEDTEIELEPVVPAGLKVCVELAWEPPRTPDRMSAAPAWHLRQDAAKSL